MRTTNDVVQIVQESETVPTVLLILCRINTIVWRLVSACFTLLSSGRTTCSMSIQFVVSLVGWSCAPLELLGDLCVAGENPAPQGLAIDFIPAALRRRCSPFSKVTLAVAHAALTRYQGNSFVPTVFASAHGEGEVTKALLVDIAQLQQLSPMGFSLSVHNTASGLYSIATGNRAASSALAAGDDSFVMGLCEALLVLRQGATEHVLYVCSDEKVPEVFLPAGASGGVPYAVALLLGRESVSSLCHLSISVAHGVDASERGKMPQAVACAQWLHSGCEQKSISSAGGTWQLTRRGELANSLFVSPMRS